MLYVYIHICMLYVYIHICMLYVYILVCMLYCYYSNCQCSTQLPQVAKMFQERKTRVQLENNLNNQNLSNRTNSSSTPVPTKPRKRVKFACTMINGTNVMNENENNGNNVASVNWSRSQPFLGLILYLGMQLESSRFYILTLVAIYIEYSLISISCCSHIIWYVQRVMSVSSDVYQKSKVKRCVGTT